MLLKIFALAAVVVAASFASFAQCGTERWPVKISTDPDARLVTGPVPTTIAQLRSIPAPRPLPQANRIAPVEDTIYSLTATLIAVKAEDDGDYDLVLSDETGRTIIAELPSTGCSIGGVFAQDIANARAAFDGRVAISRDRFRTVSIPVEIRGVGFFDLQHSQRGLAPNGIELHPVTSINFAPLAVPVPPPAISDRRRASAPSGHGTCAAPTLTVTLSPSQACSGVPVSLSWVASDASASVTIDGIGAALSSSGSVPVGTTAATLYSGHASNACGTGDEAASVLTIVPAAAASVVGPASLQQGYSASLSVAVSNATGWTLSSSLGNLVSPSFGTNNGSFLVQYAASKSGNEVITISANNNTCGTIKRTTSFAVTATPQPQPQPQPGGSLRCCDGTISPTCTNCASKQGCCSSHGGVCGCG